MGGMLDFISGAANAGAEIVGNRIAQAQKVDAEIDLQSRLTPIMAEREKAVGEVRNQQALSLRQGQADQDIANAPKKAEAEAATKRTVGAADNEVAVARERDMAPVKLENEKAKNKADLEFKITHLKELVKIKSAEAAAARDPNEAARAKIELEAAKLKLGELQQGVKDQNTVRGMINAARDVDVGQPGGKEARSFYESEAERMQKENQVIKGSTKDHTSQLKVVKGEVGEPDTLIRDDGHGGVERIDPKAIPIRGQQSAGSSQKYPDGTVLKKDGDIYDVVNGVPVKRGKSSSGVASSGSGAPAVKAEYKVLSKAGDGKYNVQTPSGNKVMTWDQMRDLGIDSRQLPG